MWRGIPPSLRTSTISRCIFIEYRYTVLLRSVHTITMRTHAWKHFRKTYKVIATLQCLHLHHRHLHLFHSPQYHLHRCRPQLRTKDHCSYRSLPREERHSFLNIIWHYTVDFISAQFLLNLTFNNVFFFEASKLLQGNFLVFLIAL